MCLSRVALNISHLFFADDLIIFAEASMNQAVVLNNVLECFY